MFEKVSENTCRPIRFSTPNPIAASESFSNPVSSPVSSLTIGMTCPILKPIRGVYSNSRDTVGRIRPFKPNPNEPVCCPSLNQELEDQSIVGWMLIGPVVEVIGPPAGEEKFTYLVKT